MQIIKYHKIPSKKIEKIDDVIRGQIEGFTAFFDENNGKFEGQHRSAFGLHHSQTAEDSWDMFVVIDSMVGDVKPDKTNKNHNNESFYFPARVIINPEIIEVPKKIVTPMPVRKVEPQKDKTVQVKIVIEDKEFPNKHSPKEGCISFPHRRSKNKERFFRIKVRYEYLDAKGKIVKCEEWIEGLKAHIFQHEVEHGLGKNMFFDK